VGELFAKQFVAAHQQVGDFKVVEVDGELIKNGGNVASYFCTPEGRVLHAITDPVPAETLLAEAQWALDLARDLKEHPPQRQRTAAALAHYHELVGAAGLQTAIQKPRGWRPTSRQDRIHELLAHRPLPLLEEIYEHVFERSRPASRCCLSCRTGMPPAGFIKSGASDWDRTWGAGRR
jgi:hypothetical protein